MDVFLAPNTQRKNPKVLKIIGHLDSDFVLGKIHPDCKF
jgi:hypothetical protein